MAALQLATGLRVQCRWIPSEVNPADRPSRLWEPAAAALGHAWRPPPGLPHPDGGRGIEGACSETQSDDMHCDTQRGATDRGGA
eukprot:2700874-Pyramimonas_sp.AAC.1